MGLWIRHLSNAIRIFQETNAQALKIEGADEIIDVIRLLTRTGIPVVAHLRFTSSIGKCTGGYKVQGKTAHAAQKLIDDAKAWKQLGHYDRSRMYSLSISENDHRIYNHSYNRHWGGG